ncbi:MULTISPECIES: carboxymuconolactone decarboxylase family protein [unclassified Sphingopyxis]|uniref:carboxymuconolactone decarboxylase family protein n=1 Tax=unclassified Sphingopyxis TaxID=2614943 RepID=UPI00072FB06E|nr:MULTISPECIES: carboxymuconolactone decarboxylase family protein [unclassified Sphingopyxis]KTE28263.1 carboxymuconolactone decarboxylase [Sphingopyxis sp. H057]KTE55355.1 carboxymuconolactone decarboxylase [Sphingopyxis sp. H073]KTE57754.1 carboxymuconolactone decarboxylase [Sphingopyxis sp. H071]KTE59771.1 carboxymuconolactone decarboxylase [Sphingopyxis sp. H100]KTE61009.1 carboxymuconolactone decarboxylase [Sphingopyxis sp. H107]
MRLTAPRIEPVDLDRLDADQRAALSPFLDNGGGKVGGGKVLNIFRTLVHAPKALTAFLGWGSYILSRRSALTPRDRELVILRTGYNCRSGYEWTQHKRIGLDSGLTENEIERIKAGPDADGWSAIDRAMLRATDDLTSNHFVSDASWAALAPLGDKGRMDLVMTVGQYTQVSMMLNSFGIQVEDGWEVDPDLKA